MLKNKGGGGEEIKSLPSGKFQFQKAARGKQSLISFNNLPLKNICCKAGW